MHSHFKAQKCHDGNTDNGDCITWGHPDITENQRMVAQVADMFFCSLNKRLRVLL